MPWGPATRSARLPMTPGRHGPSTLATNERCFRPEVASLVRMDHARADRSARRFPPSPRARQGQPTHPNALGAEQIWVFGTTLSS